MMPPNDQPDMKAVQALVAAIKDSAHEEDVVAAVTNLGTVVTAIAAIDSLARLLLPYIRVAIGSPEGVTVEMEGLVMQHPTTGKIVTLDDETQAAEKRVLRLLTLLSGQDIEGAVDVVDEAINHGLAFGDMLVFLASLYRSAYSGSLQARNMGMS